MSHKTVYMGIAASELKGEFDAQKIISIVDKIMAKYVEETAEDDDIKCDGYEIGGRLEGVIAAFKNSENILKTENGTFPYQGFNEYNAIVNNGNIGPYVIDEVEYIPVNGGLKKDIAWDAIEKLDEYKSISLLRMIFTRDPRLGGNVPEVYEIKEDGLYINSDGQSTLVLKKGETFSEWADRIGKQFNRNFLPPDAYIDTNGVWHDADEYWETFQDALINGNPDDIPEDPEQAASQAFLADFEKFMDDELKDNDCFVVLDCHCFP